MWNRTWLAAALVAMLAAAGAAAVLAQRAPAPVASVALGTDAVFASGLHEREMPPGQAPMRWTTERAVLAFRHLPAGIARLDVRIHGHRGIVTVAAGGVLVGSVPAGATGGAFEARVPGGGSLDVELGADPFAAGDGRILGTLLDAVTVTPTARRLSGPLVAAFVLPALSCLIGAAASRARPLLGVALALAVSALQAGLLWRHGVLWSAYSTLLAGLLVASCAFAAGATVLARRRGSMASGLLYGSLLLAAIVNVVLATAPFMIVSDAVLNVHMLEEVSKGNVFLTSRTQHGRPFLFPYGVSFYAILAPFHRLGLEPMALVRLGAGLSGLAMSVGALWLLLETPVIAGLAVIALQLLPGAFDRYSYGNLPNVFGQAMTALFVAWWVAGRRGWVGAALLALGALGHLSSAIVLAVVCAAFVLVFGRRVWDEGRLRTALLAGGGLTLLYYLQFIPLIVGQLPRLLEGGGQGRGVSRSAADALQLQAVGLLSEWGGPAILLAIVGRPLSIGGARDRALAAFWAAGVSLAVMAVVSPLEVRYLYALTLPLAVAAATGAWRLWSRAGAWRLVVVGLAALQGFLAADRIVHDLWFRYRPAGPW